MGKEVEGRGRKRGREDRGEERLTLPDIRERNR